MNDQTSAKGVFGKTDPKTVLILLFLAHSLSQIDRTIIAVLVPMIKADLQLSDTQLGFLTGIAFSVLYAVAGLPMARIADICRRNALVGIILIIWSGFTALSALALNFVHMLIARIGVGIGEAGLGPTAHSLIVDYFPKEKRATALSVYAAAGTVGILVGLPAASWVAEQYGWRAAFVVAGLPGVLLGVIFMLFVREPRSRKETELSVSKISQEMAAFRSIFADLWKLPAYRNIIYGAALFGISVSATIAWGPSYLDRSFGMSTSQIGVSLAVIVGVFGATGVTFGGFLADRMAQRNQKWLLHVPAFASIISLPLAAIVYSSSELMITLITWGFPTMMIAMHIGPAYAAVQSLASPSARATAAAILLFSISMLAGVGPQVIGISSDVLRPQLGEESLRISMLVGTLIGNAWGGFHMWRAGNHLKRGMDIREAEAAAAAMPEASS